MNIKQQLGMTVLLSGLLAIQGCSKAPEPENNAGSTPTKVESAPAAVEQSTSEAPLIDSGKIVYLGVEGEFNEDFMENIWDIFVISAGDTEGTRLTRFTKEDGMADWPFWSPDGSTILYAIYAEGSKHGLYLMDADGSNVRKIPGTEDFADTPTWSADGTEVAYTAPDDASGEKTKIKVVKIDGSGSYDISDPDGPLGFSTWSPKEDIMVMESGRGGGPDIYTINTKGELVYNRLTDDENLDEWPSFSKSGNQIAWANGVEDPEQGTADKDIWIMNIDGSGKRQITDGVPFGDAFPSFSPDDRQILFTSMDEKSGMGLYIVNVDGTGLKKITDGRSGVWSR